MSPDEGRSERTRIFALLVAAAMLLRLAPPAWSQAVSPVLLKAAEEAYEEEQQKEPEILSRAQVDPKLLNKKVSVYLQDGRVYRGKLVELTDEYLIVKTRDGSQRVSRADITSIEQEPRNKWKVLSIVLIVVAVGGLIVGLLVAENEG